jgi:hypothetical protein
MCNRCGNPRHVHAPPPDQPRPRQPHSRREFLYSAAVAAGGLAVSGLAASIFSPRKAEASSRQTCEPFDTPATARAARNAGNERVVCTNSTPATSRQ